MKKSKRTILTSAILSMAASTVSMSASSNSASSDTVSEMAPVYGPPSYFAENGDVNNDGEVNIIDFCMIKGTVENATSSSTYNTVYDVNKDLSLDTLDFRAVRNYFLGIIPDMQSEDPDPLTTNPPSTTAPPTTVPVIQTTYGPPATFRPYEPTQPVYGAPVTEPVAEPVTEPVTEPITGSVTESVTKSVTEPVTEPDSN